MAQLALYINVVLACSKVTKTNATFPCSSLSERLPITNASGVNGNGNDNGAVGPRANILGKFGDVVGVLWLRLHDRKAGQGANYFGSEPAKVAEVYLQGLIL